MKYCTRCGGELLKQSATKFVCTKCKRSQFRNPKGAVAILLFTPEGKLLLARRARDPEKGKLDPVGGFLDVGENFEQALYRELAEETGLTKADIANVTYLGSAYDEYAWHDEDEPVVSAYFTAQLKPDAEPKPDDDVASFEAFDINDIPEDELAWPGLSKMLEELRKQLTNQ
jgi:ADP-ribose pyrophosphatase YjhB (NUDIX family)